MVSAELIVDRVERTLVLTISNPSMRNALAVEMYPAMKFGLQEAADDAHLTSVLITGAQGMFCAGGNLHRLKANRAQPRTVQEASIGELHAMIDAVQACPKPVIAAVEGAAAGAGYSLALACDMIVASEQAQFVMAYVKVGLSPDGGGSWQLLQNLPKQLAMEQLLTGEALSAIRLHQMGVVNKLSQPGQALDDALALCRRFEHLSPHAIAAAKRLARGAGPRSLAQHMDLEKASFVDCLYGAEAGEAIDAFFEKRQANFVAHAKA